MRWSSEPSFPVLLGALGTLGTLVLSAEPANFDPVNDFCQRYSAQTAVSRNRLYIDGGLTTVNDQNFQNFTNTRLLFHDLGTNTPVNLPILDTNLTKPSKVPSVRGGYLWPDEVNGKIYLYGGEFLESEPGSNELWVYDEFNNTWDNMGVETGISRLSFGAGTTVGYRNMGYYLGGWASKESDTFWSGNRMAMSTLLQYDMTANTWSNITGPDDNQPRGFGALFNAPVGDGGLLIYFGGVRVMTNGTQVAGSMDQIDIYDAINNKWYKQNATGDIPGARKRFCGGLVTAPDRSSHEIYIYGGQGFGVNSMGYDDLYVLSMPSFTWTRLVSFAKPTPKYDMTCNIVANSSQMIVIGGQYGDTSQMTTCDVPGGGVHSVALAGGEGYAYWQRFNTTWSGYEVSPNITAVIGGTSSGGATLTSPANGWGHEDLKTQFSRVYNPPERTPTRGVPAAFGGGSATKNKKSKTIIVAIVVPVVVGIALIVGVGFLFWRRRKQAKASQPPPMDPNEPVKQQNYSQLEGWNRGADSQPTPPYHPQEMMSEPATKTHYHEIGSSSGAAPVELPSEPIYEADSHALGTGSNSLEMTDVRREPTSSL